MNGSTGYTDEQNKQIFDELEKSGKQKNQWGNYSNADIKEAADKLGIKKKSFFDKVKTKAKELVATPEQMEAMGNKKAEEVKASVPSAPKETKPESKEEDKAVTPVEEVTKQKTEKAEEKKAEAPKAEEKTAEVPESAEKLQETESEPKADPSEEVKPADGNTLDRIEKGQQSVAQYLASEHPSTIGYITDRIKNGDYKEAIRVSLKAVGSMIGGALFANGMSLLGDNSHFAEIGANTSIKNLTSEEQQKVADAIVEFQSDAAKDTIANRKIVDQWLPDMPEEKKALVSGAGIAFATADDEYISKLLTSKGFTDEEVKKVINLKPMFKYSSVRAMDNVQKVAGTKTAETAEKKTAYEFKVEQFDKLTEIDNLIAELKQKKAQVSIENKKQLADLASTIAAFYGTASNAESQSEGKNFGWNVSGSAGINAIKIVNASINGGVQSATSNAENSSTSVSGYTEEGRQQAQAVIDKMEEETLKQTVKDIQLAYDDAIKGLRQRREILAKTTKADDAVIPNGEIESVQLKDGTTVEVNANDGAVLTTNPVSDVLISFDEGEVNPFEWLGYDDDKKPFEYYEHLLDNVPDEITSFEEAMELVR